MPQSLREQLGNQVSDPLEQMGTLADMLEFGGLLVTAASYNVAVANSVELLCNPSGAQDINLPAAEQMVGKKVFVKNLSANTVTINPDDPSEEIDGNATHALSSQYDAVLMSSDGSVWHILSKI